MRFRTIVWITAVIFTLALLPGTTRAQATGDTLTLQDLVGHPERLPDYVIMSDTIKFGGGLALRKGEKVHTLDFDGKTLRVTVGHTNFPIGADECDLLSAANTAWQALTPAQRAVDLQTLVKDASLWPATVKVLVSVPIKGHQFPPNTEFTLGAVTPKGITIYSPQIQTGLTGVMLSDTDLLAQARELAKIEPDKRPSRVVEELKGKLVDADGSPAKVDLDGAKYFAIYYGANWCPWCHKLSPTLIKTMNEIGPRNPKLVFVMINDDDQPSEMLKYMTDSKMPWPALPKAHAIKVGVLRSMMYTEPQLRILDHYGNELFNEPGGAQEQADADTAALMKLDASGEAK
jgi:thiol-disulfide isomerase/thioredoxin